jgi:hypothetical protein
LGYGETNIGAFVVVWKDYQVKNAGPGEDEAGKSDEGSFNAVSGIYSLLVRDEVVPWYRIKDSANIFLWHRGTSSVVVSVVSLIAAILFSFSLCKQLPG